MARTVRNLAGQLDSLLDLVWSGLYGALHGGVVVSSERLLVSRRAGRRDVDV